MTSFQKKLTKSLLESFKQDKSKQIEEEIITDQPSIDYNIEDQIGNIWIVKKAMKESTEDDLVQETDIFGLAEMINQQQISRADIHGIYQMENKARRASTKCISEKKSEHKSLIKEAESTKKEIEKKIKDIQLEIKSLTDKGMKYPGSRDSVSADLDPLYQELTKLEKLKEKLETSIEKEKPKKENDK